MSADDSGQFGSAPETGAIDGDGAAVSRLPVPPNARVDGLGPRATGLAAFLVREVGRLPAPAQMGGRGGQILFAARRREASRRRVRRTVGAGAALAAAGLVAWTVANRPLPSTLSYTVDGAAPSPDGYVRSSAAHEPELAFSDGTSIHMMRGARARVLEVGRRGARLVLEDGRAHVHVVHRPGADWQVQAGSFVVHVQGTAFVVGWDAAQARFDLQMENGVVSVDGPRSSDRVTLRAGQSLSARLDGSRVVSTTEPTTGPTIAGRVTAPPSSGSGPAPVEAAGPPTAPESAPRPGAPRLLPSLDPPRLPWSEQLADGDAAGIVAEAQRRGVANVLATASTEDLAALADAARFRMQDRLARRVLLTQRSRFPGTLRANEASFLLGRLAEGRGGRPADALAWYDRYLREAPSGAYAAEAMGRMMIVLEREKRSEEARAVASQYLHRFPQGVYARAARALTSP